MRLVYITYIFIFAMQANASPGVKVGLHNATSSALNEVLEHASLLHDAFYSQNDQEIETNLRNLVRSIQIARNQTSVEKGNGLHINRILDTAHYHFRSIMRAIGDERRKNLRLGYEQIVLIAQTYKLNNYRIFYCGKTDTIWLQKGYKAQNPFNPQGMGDCGVLVR